MSMPRFWETKTPDEMNEEEWESLCDGCGRCCLLKLEDIETGDTHYTNVICKYHDNEACRCTEYKDRSRLVPDCIKVTPDVARTAKWLPDTCAYRLLAEDKLLFDWHPLISSNPNSVDEAGFTITDKVVSEEFVHPDELDEHLIHWLD